MRWLGYSLRKVVGMLLLYLLAGGDLFDLSTLVSLFMFWVVIPVLVFGGVIYVLAELKRPLKKDERGPDKP